MPIPEAMDKIFRDGEKPILVGSYLVPVRYGMRTGVFDRGADNNMRTIDLTPGNPVADEISRLSQSIKEEMLADPEVLAILNKENPDENDRMQWEELLFSRVSKESQNGYFGGYRTEWRRDDDPGLKPYQTVISQRRIAELEQSPLPFQIADPAAIYQLATVPVFPTKDINRLDEQAEFNCNTQTVVKGIIAQKVEDDVLHGRHDALRPSAYYTASGYLDVSQPFWGDAEKTVFRKQLGHAALISSATGNMIEATDTISPYIRAADKWEFADFVKGLPFDGTFIEDKNHSYRYAFMSVIPNPFEIVRRHNAIYQEDFDSLIQEPPMYADHNRQLALSIDVKSRAEFYEDMGRGKAIKEMLQTLKTDNCEPQLKQITEEDLLAHGLPKTLCVINPSDRSPS